MTLFLLPFLQLNAHRHTSFSSLWRQHDAWYFSRATYLSVSDMFLGLPYQSFHTEGHLRNWATYL